MRENNNVHVGQCAPAKLLLVGHPAEFHIGAHLARAARSLGLEVQVYPVQGAYRGPWLLRKYHWWWTRRPPRLDPYNEELLEACRAFRPQWLLATGLAPLTGWMLNALKYYDVKRLNYLTDDPWNPGYRSTWLLEALPNYDRVFSPRRANLEDLRTLGCPRVEYLPFGYCPDLHWPEPPETAAEARSLNCEVLFVGGADADRVPYIAALAAAGFRVKVHGGFWNRYRLRQVVEGGWADQGIIRRATGGARVTLCLVRRANRDGHVMRSFEAAASGACLLMEYTAEHEAIFGPHLKSVCFFSSIPEMVERCRVLLDDAALRRRLSQAASACVVGGRHTYRDRLAAMLELPLPVEKGEGMIWNV